MWTLGAALALCGALWAVAGGVKPAPVAVPRCCPPGQQLGPAALRVPMLSGADAAGACAAANQTRQFAPRIYRPLRGGFFDPGVLPQHWRPAYEALPECESLRVLPDHSAAYALLANNGSLMIMRGGSSALSTARYCADAGAALVCDEDVVWVPPKCCSEGRALDGARCVDEPAGAAAAMRELRALAGNGTVGLGFPVCADGTAYAVAGLLAGARLAPDFALELRAAGEAGGAGSARVAAGAWCADAERGAGGARIPMETVC